MALYVNNEKIEEEEVQKEVERLRARYEQTFPEQSRDEQRAQLEEWSRENVIERVLLRQAALRDPEEIPADEIEKALRALIEERGGEEPFRKAFGVEAGGEDAVRKDVEERLRVERMIEKIARDAPEPTEEDLRKFYDENPDQFMVPETVRASHIVKHLAPNEESGEILEEMKRILKKLRNNENFEEMARTCSDCPDNGGDLGVFPRGQMVREFDDAVFALEEGEISGVFRTEFGYHIAKVTEKHPAHLWPFEEARETIARELPKRMRQDAIDAFVDKEKEKATIEERDE